MPSPRPSALRIAPADASPLPRPPFGLRRWSDAHDAPVAVLLSLPAGWPPTGLGDVDTIAAQLPDPSSLAAGTLVVILGEGMASPGLFGRLLRPRGRIARAVRASALLVRGYVDIGGGLDPSTRQDLAWGYAAVTPH